MTEKMKASASYREARGGIILIVLGLVLLVGQFVSWGPVATGIPLLLGAGFMAWGIATRQAGFLIPGGILSGVGLGTLIVGGPFAGWAVVANHHDSWFLGSFALGWLSITLASALFTDRRLRWPLIPAAIMGFIALSLAAGGAMEMVLGLAGRLWPILFIYFGLRILWPQLRPVK